MHLPHADRAEIDVEKLRGYVLSPTHPVGRFKARFFAALGYSGDDWQSFDADLRIQHLTQDAEPGEITPYGRPFTIRAILKGPNGESARRRAMTLHPLDVVVLTRDIPVSGLRSGDLGTVVEVYGSGAIAVEFVAASGRTQAVITLRPEDLRQAGDDDLVTVRPSSSSTLA